MKKSLKPLLVFFCMSMIFIAAGCAEAAQTGSGSPSDSSIIGTESVSAADTAVESAAAAETTAGSITAPIETIPNETAPDATTPNVTSPNETTPSSGIDIKTAIAAALTHAGLTEDQITLVKTKSDTEDGVPVYDIEFTSSTMRYEYDVRTSDGTIVSFSAEQIPIVEPQRPSEGGTEIPSYISEAEARAALKHAGLTEAQVTFIKTKLDYDGGRVEYDIEFTANLTRYEYEISAVDGTVLEFSSEALPSQGENQSGSVLISEEEAKAIALSHIGFTADQVTFTEVKLDQDDGIFEYEIEFRVGNIKYEVKINAASGLVLEVDIDD